MINPYQPPQTVCKPVVTAPQSRLGAAYAACAVAFAVGAYLGCRFWKMDGRLWATDRPDMHLANLGILLLIIASLLGILTAILTWQTATPVWIRTAAAVAGIWCALPWAGLICELTFRTPVHWIFIYGFN